MHPSTEQFKFGLHGFFKATTDKGRSEVTIALSEGEDTANHPPCRDRDALSLPPFTPSPFCHSPLPSHQRVVRRFQAPKHTTNITGTPPATHQHRSENLEVLRSDKW
ncbi:hypothetical protein E2C01_073150 [Portunus trituberculatus]|uniref:Uncharacterized protein n=1 Tax=Portunus trituberculatus TaxID=210409 RepID=A0A5B7I9T9_PORTR|nr:hypothetical protein [Portunus trituberculatus]